MTIRITREGPAPRATRTPISRVGRLVASSTEPYSLGAATSARIVPTGAMGSPGTLANIQNKRESAWALGR